MSVLQDCPQCGAMVRPDAAWCSLCYQRLDRFDPLTAPLDEVLTSSVPQESASPAVPETAAAPAPATYDPLTAPLSALAGPAADPPGPVGHEVESDAALLAAASSAGGTDQGADAAASDVDVMLALLHAEHRQSDTLGPWAERLRDPGARVVVMVGGTLVLSLVMFGMLALLAKVAS